MNKVLASVTYRLVHSGILQVAADFTIADIETMSREYQSFSRRHDFHKIGGDTFEVLCLMLYQQSCNVVMKPERTRPVSYDSRNPYAFTAVARCLLA